MKFLDKIKTLPEDKLDKVIKRRIRYLEDKSNKNNPDEKTIGYHIGYNPVYYGTDDGENMEVNLRCVYNDFVSKDSMLVYGMEYSENGFASNRGMYYYVDDQSYLYDFCRYIREMEDMNDYYFFGYVRDFICGYCGIFRGRVTREKMHSLLTDVYGNNIPPFREHSLSNFKGKGNAFCTEYAVMAQNILQLFGYDSSIIVGNAIFGDQGEGHAYNLVTFKEKDTGEEVDAVIDFINPVDIYDINYNKIGEEPFIGFIEDFNQEKADNFVLGQEHLVFDEYYFLWIADTLLRIDVNETREYFISNYIGEDYGVNYSKNYKSA